MQVRMQQLELDMEKQTGSQSEKEYVKAVYCHPAELKIDQSWPREKKGLVFVLFCFVCFEGGKIAIAGIRGLDYNRSSGCG